MPVDFNINLAKDITSSEEERLKFYNGMLVYLVVCAALLVLSAYLTSLNLNAFLQNRDERKTLIETTVAVSGVQEDAFKNPEAAYVELDMYSRKVRSLKKLLGQRVQLLPIVNNLFSEMPSGVALQNLAANKTKVTFGLIMPPPSDEGGDLSKDLREAWEKNEELMRHVTSIRALTGERQTVGSELMYHIRFECILKK